MPGYIIHLAVGKIYSQNNKIEDIESFEKGIMAPDMLEDKSKSHYGPYSSQPGLNQFLREKGISTSYQEGYFLHLLTDYLFYHKFLTRWDKSIYSDYNKLNSILINKYKITVLTQIQEKVKFEEGTPEIIDEEKLEKFINTVGKINVRKIIKEKQSRFEEQMSRHRFLI